MKQLVRIILFCLLLLFSKDGKKQTPEITEKEQTVIPAQEKTDTITMIYLFPTDVW